MTRRLILSLLILGVMAVVFAVVRSFESRMAPGWQSELERYLQLSESPLNEVRIIAAVEAASPQNFVSNRVTAVPTDWTWDGISKIPPPISVQCVRLEGSASNHDVFEAQSRWEILLIGYHDDGLWHSGWLVHQFNFGVTEEELRTILFSLGCDLGLDNLQTMPTIIQKTIFDM